MRKKTKPSLSREGYFRALALDTLSSHAHEMSNMLDDCKGGANEELSYAMAIISSELHQEARKHFPRYPHDDHAKGTEWARAEGIS